MHQVEKVAGLVGLEGDHELLVVDAVRVGRVDRDLRVLLTGLDVTRASHACAPRAAAGTTRAFSTSGRRTGTWLASSGRRAGPPPSTPTSSSSPDRSRGWRPSPSSHFAPARRGTRGCRSGRGSTSTASGRCHRGYRRSSRRAGSGPHRSLRRRRRTRACGVSRSIVGQAAPGRIDLQEREFDEVAIHRADTNIRRPARSPFAGAVHVLRRRHARARQGQPPRRDRVLARPAATREAARDGAARAGARARRLRLHVVDPGRLHAPSRSCST